MITLIIAESALETIPKELAGHSSVKNYAAKLGRKPLETLLDRSFHHSAMTKFAIKDDWKRGRPDIVHFALMESLSCPLYLKQKLDVYVHTYRDKVISVGNSLRIPKSYHRFEGLMMGLFKDKIIQNENGHVLLRLYDDVSFDKLIKEIVKPDLVVGFSTSGVQGTVKDAVTKALTLTDNCAFVVGGFPRGHFSNDTGRLFDFSHSISEFGLEAHVVIARIVYECEQTLL
jgi:rRNA small subunit pseudouridine methyltransferase Nep1